MRRCGSYPAICEHEWMKETKSECWAAFKGSDHELRSE